MGVTGLLKALKSVGEPTSIGAYAGQTVGVDGYSWLHKFAISSARQLALGEPTTRFIDAFNQRISMIENLGVKLYIVFDGGYLPTKASVEETRHEAREKAKARGLLLHREGNLRAADDQFQKSLDVTPTMAAMVIEALKHRGIPYVVAPYEADAQLVYLEKQGIIQAIISEDSDLLVFGANVLLTKMDHAGNCVAMCRDNFPRCKEMAVGEFTAENWRTLAILSGCDYSSGLSGIGPIKSHVLIRRHRTFDRIIRALRLEGNVKIPADFEDVYRQAALTFMHQRVYCPVQCCLVMLTEPDEPITDSGFHNYIGPELEPELATRIAIGSYDPITKLPIELPWTGTLQRTLSTPTRQHHSSPVTRINSTPARPSTSFFSRTIKTPVSIAKMASLKTNASLAVKAVTTSSTPVRATSSPSVVLSSYMASTSITNRTSTAASTPSNTPAPRPRNTPLTSRSVNILPMPTEPVSLVTKRIKAFLDSDSDDEQPSTSRFFKSPGSTKLKGLTTPKNPDMHIGRSKENLLPDDGSPDRTPSRPSLHGSLDRFICPAP